MSIFWNSKVIYSNSLSEIIPRLRDDLVGICVSKRNPWKYNHENKTKIHLKLSTLCGESFWKDLIMCLFDLNKYKYHN